MSDGFFTPSSITWRVHRHPTMLLGGLRALMLQTFHPLAMAGVAQHSDYEKRSLDRLRRTSFYVAATTYGDRATALAAAARVKKVHERVRGIDPITGQAYSAADPETQLFVHCAEVHSFLTAYRTLVEPLSVEDQDRYFAENAQVGALLDMPLETIPKSVAEMRAYFDRVRPRLCVSETSTKALRFITEPPITKDLALVAPLVRLMSRAALALLPGHLRKLAGLTRSRAADDAVLLALRPTLHVSALRTVRELSPLRAFNEHVVGREAVAYARMAWEAG